MSNARSQVDQDQMWKLWKLKESSEVKFYLYAKQPMAGITCQEFKQESEKPQKVSFLSRVFVKNLVPIINFYIWP